MSQQSRARAAVSSQAIAAELRRLKPDSHVLRFFGRDVDTPPASVVGIPRRSAPRPPNTTAPAAAPQRPAGDERPLSPAGTELVLGAMP